MRIGYTMTAVILTLFATGCEVVDDSDYTTVQKIKGGQLTLIGTQELSELKRQAEIGKGVGRYQIHREGFRTWGLDTSTGQICLLLTADSDWKKPEISAQGCH